MKQIKFTQVAIGQTFTNKSSRSVYKRVPDNWKTKAGRAEWVKCDQAPDLVGKSCVYPKNANVFVD